MTSRKDDNGSMVTAKLLGLIQKMPLEERLKLLTHVERKLLSDKNHRRREYDRQDYLINIDYMVKDRLYKGFSLNISANGVFIESSKNLLPNFSPGDQVILSFDHPGSKEHMKVSGKLARIDKKGIGIMFDQTMIDWHTP